VYFWCENKKCVQNLGGETCWQATICNTGKTMRGDSREKPCYVIDMRNESFNPHTANKLCCVQCAEANAYGEAIGTICQSVSVSPPKLLDEFWLHLVWYKILGLQLKEERGKVRKVTILFSIYTALWPSEPPIQSVAEVLFTAEPWIWSFTSIQYRN
jgi:hypothetical protein